jgi:6-pyruvoyl-tetrahydropterin synthase
MFQVTLAAKTLDHQGFVADFDLLEANVLRPCHLLLDHSLAVGEDTFREIREPLTSVGTQLVASRDALHGHLGEPQAMATTGLAGARNETPGGIKLCVFPFTPTSERIAEWLHHLAQQEMGDARVHVERTRVYETLHPVESFAEYCRDSG